MLAYYSHTLSYVLVAVFTDALREMMGIHRIGGGMRSLSVQPYLLYQQEHLPRLQTVRVLHFALQALR